MAKTRVDERRTAISAVSPFETLHDVKHPLYGALFDLRSLETVGIIEGEGWL